MNKKHDLIISVTNTFVSNQIVYAIDQKALRGGTASADPDCLDYDWRFDIVG